MCTDGSSKTETIRHLKAKPDNGRTRTCDPFGIRFLVLRLNRSATLSICMLHGRIFLASKYQSSDLSTWSKLTIKFPNEGAVLGSTPSFSGCLIAVHPHADLAHGCLDVRANLHAQKRQAAWTSGTEHIAGGSLAVSGSGADPAMKS